MKPALILVDWQRDFLSGRPIVPGAAGAVDEAARLLEACRDGGVPVIHGRMTVDRDPDSRMPHWKAVDRWECERGTLGCEAPEPLREKDGETIIEKRYYRVFAGGELEEALLQRGVDTVIISGVYLHACVRAAALDAYELGYAVWIAEDAVASDRPLAAAETRDYLSARGIRFAPAEELVSNLKAAAGAVEAEGRAELEVNAELAVGAAREAWEEWRRISHEGRVRCLRALAGLLEDEAEDLARGIAESVGKPIGMARGEVARCRLLVDTLCAGGDDAGVVELGDGSWRRRRPLGVVAMLTPWNHPIAIPVGKFVPALLHGNAVVWKPAPVAHGVAERLLALVRRAGWPEGLLTLMEGGAEAGMALMRHREVAAVTLTGGDMAGYAAQLVCAERRIPLQAELGGNNAAIVWSDAGDLELAAEEIARGAFGFAGQRCTANRRVIVEAVGVDAFFDCLQQATAALSWGEVLDEGTVVGPLVSKAQRDRVARVVERARQSGLRVAQPLGPAGSSPQGSDGARAWYPPTIIVCDQADHEVVQEETFGPVLVVQPATDWEMALRLCNGVGEGLVAAVFTASAERQADFLQRAQAGVLKINEATADVGVEAPFGGWKGSGIGPPEHGVGNREFYTRWQAIYGEDFGGGPDE